METKMWGAIVGAVIFILIVFIYTWSCSNKTIKTVVVKTPPAKPIPTAPLVGTAKTWRELSPDEKLDYLVTKYFSYDSGDTPDSQIQIDNQFIASLPQDGNCKDDFDGCIQWAANGECDINPEYMLYNCKSSCKSCALTEQQKNDVTEILNKRAPPGCAFHGNAYPGNLPYYYKVLSYR